MGHRILDADHQRSENLTCALNTRLIRKSICSNARVKYSFKNPNHWQRSETEAIDQVMTFKYLET